MAPSSPATNTFPYTAETRKKGGGGGREKSVCGIELTSVMAWERRGLNETEAAYETPK